MAGGFGIPTEAAAEATAVGATAGGPVQRIVDDPGRSSVSPIKPAAEAPASPAAPAVKA